MKTDAARATALTEDGWVGCEGGRGRVTRGGRRSAAMAFLERKSEGLVGWVGWEFDSVEEGLALDSTALRFLSLALVPLRE
jgi:hypothetical protein